MQILVYTVLCGTGSDSKHKTYHCNFLVGLEAHHGYVSVLIKPDDDIFSYISQSHIQSHILGTHFNCLRKLQFLDILHF